MISSSRRALGSPRLMITPSTARPIVPQIAREIDRTHPALPEPTQGHGLGASIDFRRAIGSERDSFDFRP